MRSTRGIDTDDLRGLAPAIVDATAAATATIDVASGCVAVMAASPSRAW